MIVTRARTFVALTGAAFLASPLRAHGDESVTPDTWWRVWSFEPVIIVTLLVAAAWYGHGLRRIRRATGVRSKLSRAAWCYGAGWVGLVTALVSPVHPAGQELFSMHMVQHELLMVVAAPLLVLGRPGLVGLWALSRPHARTVTAEFKRCGGERVWAAVASPFNASLLHALALWLWHVPAWFEATRDHEFIHALQHVSFLVTALIFWHAVFFGPKRRAGHGLTILYLFATAAHSGALGALITFATRLWYPSYDLSAPAWGLTGLEDQQLGGIIMWVPAGLIYVAAALALFARWLADSDSKSNPRGGVAAGATLAATITPATER